MADLVKRISDKSQIEMGTEETNVSGSDVLLTQHTTGDNKDYSIPLNYIQAIPVGKTDTASATATKVVTLLNYPSGYPLVVGSKILVTFTNANTATTQLYLTVGTVTKPATVKGFALKSAIAAGSQIEFTYTGTSFNCQDFAISSIDVTSLQPVNSSAVNGALANYEKITEYDYATSVDANTIKQEGIYRFKATYTGTATNLPTWQKTGGAILEVHNMGTYCVQRFIPYGDDTIVYIRKKSYGSGSPNYKWTSWDKEMTETSLSNTLANYHKTVSFATVTKKYYELIRFSNTEVVHIDGGMGYGANFGVIEFDLNVSPTVITGDYINKTGNGTFGLYLYKNTDTEYILYASGYDWASLRFNCSKAISGNITGIDTPTGTEVQVLKIGNQGNPTLNSTLANYSRVTLLNFGNNTTVSISLTPKHAYRMTMGHPLVQNKKGYYDMFFLSNTEYKIDNLSTDNNYTFSVSNNTLTITSSSSYGFVYVEDLGSWG